MQLTQLAHQKLAHVIQAGDVVVDATVGNGYDTCFLADKVGPNGIVIGFDIQPQALAKTLVKLKEHRLESRVQLHQTSHAHITSIVQPWTNQRRCSAVMFNLGYLPGSNKRITTQVASTLAALQAGFELLDTAGCMSAMLYTGHPGGRAEAEAIQKWSQTIPTELATVEHIAPTNSKATSPPELIVVHKRPKQC